MNCDELFQFLKVHAPSKETCMTKSEFRSEADKKFSGIPGDRLKDCLEKFQNEGKVKKDVKCVRTCDCYYDPPTSQDPLTSLKIPSEDLLFEAISLLSGFAEGFTEGFTESCLKRAAARAATRSP